MRRNPKVEAAIEKFREFHDAEPRRVSSFADSFKIPETIVRVGPAVDVMYRSNKWGERADYIHEHDKGVHVHLPRSSKFPGRAVQVPAWIRNTDALSKLGLCLGFTFRHQGEDVEAEVTAPLPELYCTPDGRALLVIAEKRRVEAIIWGGNLGVEARGIVN